jgi:hypothetical protein
MWCRSVTTAAPLLVLCGCASLTPVQQAALYCNPAAHAIDLALAGLSYVWLSPPLLEPCVDAIKTLVIEKESRSGPSPFESPSVEVWCTQPEAQTEERCQGP